MPAQTRPKPLPGRIAAGARTLKILILSPHRDDAAFSLTLAIHQWLLARHTVTVLNVFTRSRFAPYSDAAFVHENDELSYVSAMRLREDQLWVRRIQESLPKGLKSHLQLAEVNLKDAPIRLRVPIEQVCTTAVDLADPITARPVEKIRRTLTRMADEGAMDALVLPAAMGNHVDHLIVREAAQPFTTNRPTAWFEELPYAVTHTTAQADLEALRTAAVDRGEDLTELRTLGEESTDTVVARKRKLILNYASQIDEEAADIIAGAPERLWGNPRWMELFA